MNFPPALLACATCMPDQGTAVADATNAAIFFMVGIIGVVLSVFLGIIVRFSLKQRRFARQSDLAAHVS